MVGINDIVITGIGCVTPLGIGEAAFRQALLEGQCAIRPYVTLSDSAQTTYYAAQLTDFDGKQYVTPRKALKVMGREVQIAFSAAHLAWQNAGLADFTPASDRVGVVYGTEVTPGDVHELVPAIGACVDSAGMNFSKWGGGFAKHIYPLWMLKYLPNMAACHVGIAIDARGPNNSLAMEEASGLLALGEAAQIIRRGDADLMVVGACGSRVTPTRMMYRAPDVYDQHPLNPTHQEAGPRSRPFDLHRHGIVPAEGAATFVLERRSHAVKRGAKILGQLAGHSSRYGRPTRNYNGSRQALASAASDSLQQAGITAAELSHVSAQGFSELYSDIEEAAAIANIAPSVPVTAFSSYFGTAGAACGLLELAASILTTRAGYTLPTLGYSQPDPNCPIHVCQAKQGATSEYILKMSYTLQGQAAAVVVQCMS
jgi:3-oxoacyl-[acyl-carrier-protein] synthase II